LSTVSRVKWARGVEDEKQESLYSRRGVDVTMPGIVGFVDRSMDVMLASAPSPILLSEVHR